MKLTEVVKKLMADTIGEQVLNDKDVEVKEFEHLYKWFENYGIVVLLKDPRWIINHGIWAETYIAFEEGENIIYGVRGILPTEEERNIIVIGGKMKKDSAGQAMKLKVTDPRLVLLSYLFEKHREGPKEELELLLRYAKAVPTVGVAGAIRYESIFANMSGDDQKTFLEALRTESRDMPHLREAVNILDRSEIDISYV